MRKLFVVLLIVMVPLIGCKQDFIKLKSVDETCIDKTDFPNSKILQKLENPCRIHNAIATTAKVQIALDEWTYTDVHNKIAAWVLTLEAVDKISAKEVKDAIFLQLSKVNKKVGVSLFIASDALMEFNDDAEFESEDIDVLILALKDLDSQCKSMTVFQ